MSAWVSNISHGDFVACRINDGDKNITIIKRLVAMEGDFVEILDGRVFINGERHYQNDDNVIYAITDSSFLLGKGEFFVLGDNGAESLDGRILGVFEKNQIVAKVVIRLLPFERFEVF
jgi:signal peptidase I